MRSMQDHILTALQEITQSHGLDFLTQPHAVNTGHIYAIAKAGHTVAITGTYAFNSDYFRLTLTGPAVDAADLQDNPPSFRYQDGALACSYLRYDDHDRVRAMLDLFTALLRGHTDRYLSVQPAAHTLTSRAGTGTTTNPHVIGLPDGELRIFEPDHDEGDPGRMYVLDVLGKSVLVRERSDGTYIHIDDDAVSEPVPNSRLVYEVNNGGEHHVGE